MPLEQALSIFRSLLDLPESEYEPFILEHCRNAPELEREVRRLLAEHKRAGGFLETPAASISEALEEEVTLPAPRLMFRPGEVLARRFVIERLAGAGGMGEVYEAYDRELRTPVAVKTLRNDLVSRAGMIQRFHQEVSRARVVAHPHVCKVFDLFLHSYPDGSEVPFFTMELLSGETLAQRLKNQGKLGVTAALPVLKDIAAALQAAHDLGIIHRDLNPKNVFLCNDSRGRTRVVVTDFGLAVPAESANSGGTVTRLFAGAGFPPYMAPEQKLMQPLSKATDVYALGLMAYELAMGSLPPESPQLLLDELPASWRDAIRRCLLPDPSKRFSSASEFIAAIDDSESTAADPPREKNRPINRRNRPVLVVAACLALALFLWGLWWSMSPETISIAVAPFQAKDTELAYLGEGIADDIASAFTSFPDLHVASLNYAEHVDRPDGKTLGVDLVLSGSVQQRVDRLLVSAELVEASTNRLLWSKIFDRDSRQLPAIQSEIISETVAKMGLKAPKQPAERETTDSPEALDLYRRGRYLWGKRAEADLKKGLRYFEESRDKDPSFALAYNGIADTFTILADYGLVSPAEAFEKAGAALRTSLELRPNLADTHASNGLFNALIVWDQRAAERSFQKALALNPSSILGHFWYGVYLTRARRLDEALKEAKLARALDPVAPATVLFVAWAHYYMKDYDAAITVIHDVLDLNPDYAHAHQLLALCLAAQGRTHEALKENELAVSGLTDAFVQLRYRGQVLSFIPEKKNEAYQVAARLGELSTERQAGYLAVIYAALGDREKTYEWIDRSIVMRDAAVLLVNVASPMDSYRNEGRFLKALQLMGY